MASGSRTPLLVHAALFAVSLLFGTNTVVAKVALREITPIDLVVFRTAATAAVLFGVSRLLRGDGPPPAPLARPDLARLLLYSLLGASINQLCFLAGLARSTATNASLMVVAVYVLLQPVVAATLGRVFLHEQFGPHTALAAALVVAGVILSTWRRA